MGSIRPLVTITILAAVGVYLYMKINEGPVPTRAGTKGVDQSPDGVPPLTGMKGTSLAADSAAPAWPTTAISTTPPPITPAPAPTAVSPHAAGSPASTAIAKESLPAVPAIPELPPLPMNEPASSATQPSASPPKDATNVAGQPSRLTATATDSGKASPPLTTPAPIAPPTSPAHAPATNASPQPAPTSVGATSTTPPTQASAQDPLRTMPATTASDDRYGTTPSAATKPAAATTATTPLDSSATTFAASWPAIQSALDHRDLKQAHQLLSKWHANESLSPTDTEKVETLLSQLAGTVIYSTEHQLEPARVVKPGETLDAIAKEYNVPSQLLAKINGIQTRDELQPGQQLKVVRGPFAAVIDLSRNELTLTVDERYAGKFRVTVPPGTMLTDGQWLVDQKVAGSTGTAGPTAYATTPIAADRRIVLRNAEPTAAGAPTLIIASGQAPTGLPASPPTLSVSPQDAEELSDILSVGSRVVVRK